MAIRKYTDQTPHFVTEGNRLHVIQRHKKVIITGPNAN